MTAPHSPASATGPSGLIGVIGGSGSSFLGDAREVPASTPFGAPSDPVTVGEVVPTLPSDDDGLCHHTLDGLELPFTLP